MLTASARTLIALPVIGVVRSATIPPPLLATVWILSVS
jgi:hypothetical protein